MDLASLQDDVYTLLEEVYELHNERGIKDMKDLSSKELQCGGDLKSYLFQDFTKITDTECQKELLRELLDGTFNMNEFKSECKTINKRGEAQRAFMKAVGESSWETTSEVYPLHSTAESLDRFNGLNFKRSLPEVWRSYIKSAKRFKEGIGMYLH